MGVVPSRLERPVVEFDHFGFVVWHQYNHVRGERVELFM